MPALADDSHCRRQEAICKRRPEVQDWHADDEGSGFAAIVGLDCQPKNARR
jgi:hypothetical protein